MNRQVGNVQLMQKMNRLKVLNYVRANPGVARPTIATETGLSLPSLTNVTTYLLNEGLLKEIGQEDVGRVGRKGMLLKINERAFELLLVFIYDLHFVIVHTDLEGTVIDKTRVDMNETDPEKLVLLVRRNVMRMLSKCTQDKIRCIGVAQAKSEDSEFLLQDGVPVKHLEIKDVLEKETGIPVYLEKISVIRAIGYFSSHSELNEDNVLFVDIDNGVRTVWIKSGEVNRFLPENIGHMTVEPDGDECYCGNKGCLEAMSSVKRMLSRYAELSGNNARITAVHAQYTRGNPNAVAVVKECAEYIGIGIANMINLCNPKLVVINEGQFAKCPSVISETVNVIRRRTSKLLTDNLTVVEAVMQENDTAVGGAKELCNILFDIDSNDCVVQ